MYFSNQLARVTRISDGILKTYFMWIYFREHQNVTRRLQKNAKSQKVREFVKFYPHENLSTKLANNIVLKMK